MGKTKIDPVFMRSLVQCHMFKKEAKSKVVHNKRFYKHVLKVFSWQRRIRKQIEANNNGSSDNSPQQSTTSSCSTPPSITSIQTPILQQESILSTISTLSSGSFASSTESSITDEFICSQNVVIKKESFAETRLTRKDIWLMIVRNDVLEAQKRKLAFKEQKLLKTKMIALRCQSHFIEFQRLNNKQKQDGIFL